MTALFPILYQKTLEELAAGYDDQEDSNEEENQT